MSEIGLINLNLLIHTMHCPTKSVLVASLAALAFSPSMAQAQQADARKPGSVLIFAGQRSGPGSFTILSVTNSNQTPASPTSVGGSTNLHFEYVNTTYNAENPFCPTDCVIFDRHEMLTPADTLSVLTYCHNSTAPGASEGYVVVSAQDPLQFNVPVCHDYLLGSEMMFNASGMLYSLNAIPVQCAAGSDGTPTDVNANGKLDFDGVEYRVLADTIYIESFIAVPRSRLCLISLTGGCRDLHTVYFSLFNDNEFPLSATLTFKTWFDMPLSQISPVFDGAFLASVPNDPEELDVFCTGVGVIETGWAEIQSLGVRLPGGQSLTSDGVLVGCISSGIGGDPLLWTSTTSQSNGVFLGQ